jgi:hypothetical protein
MTQKKGREQLLAALNEIADALDAWRKHDCAGWDCVVCQPSRLSEIAREAIKAEQDALKYGSETGSNR